MKLLTHQAIGETPSAANVCLHIKTYLRRLLRAHLEVFQAPRKINSQIRVPPNIAPQKQLYGVYILQVLIYKHTFKDTFFKTSE